MIKSFVLVALLTSTTLAHAASGASPRTAARFSCKDMFQIAPEVLEARAFQSAITAHPRLAKYVRGDVFETPRILALIGEVPENRQWEPSKERVVTDALFAVANRYGRSTAMMTSDKFFAEIRATDKKNGNLPTFPRIQILAISDLHLWDMGAVRHKALADIIRIRFDRHQSTIILTDGEVIDDEWNLISSIGVTSNRIKIAERYGAINFAETKQYGLRPLPEDEE